MRGRLSRDWRTETFESASQAREDLEWQIRELLAQGFTEVEHAAADALEREMDERPPRKQDSPPQSNQSGAPHLDDWWKRLSAGWKAVIRRSAGFEGEPGAPDMQTIASLGTILVGEENIGGDLSPLASLSRIERISLYEVRISSLKPLAGLSELKDLDLYGTGIDSVSPLRGLKKLRTLRLANNPELTDLSPILSLPALASLDISGTGVEDILPLKKLRRLSRLVISQSSDWACDLEKWSDEPGCSIVTDT